MIQWEYRSINVQTSGWFNDVVDAQMFDEELNEMGRHGWELVSVFDTSDPRGKTVCVIATFKRPVQA